MCLHFWLAVLLRRELQSLETPCLGGSVAQPGRVWDCNIAFRLEKVRNDEWRVGGPCTQAKDLEAEGEIPLPTDRGPAMDWR